MLRTTTILTLLAGLTFLGCQQSAPAPVAVKEPVSEPVDEVGATLAKLDQPDRELALEQVYCVVNTTGRLGSMGVPLKLDVEGTPVFVCCAGCKKRALADPAATLAKLAELKSQHRETK